MSEKYHYFIKNEVPTGIDEDGFTIYKTEEVLVHCTRDEYQQYLERKKRRYIVTEQQRSEIKKYMLSKGCEVS